MVFYISIKHDRRNIRLKVERLDETTSFEKFRITASNRSFVLQSNRPLLRGKGLKYRRIDWKVIEGGFNNSAILESIIAAIETKTKDQ